MSESKKITAEELSNLKVAAEMVDRAELTIGRLEVKKLQLLAEHEIHINSFRSIKAELLEKYGEVSIDFATGELTENESKEKDAE